MRIPAEAGPVEPTTATAKAVADKTRRIEVLIEVRIAISFSRAVPQYRRKHASKIHMAKMNIKFR